MNQKDWNNLKRSFEMTYLKPDGASNLTDDSSNKAYGACNQPYGVTQYSDNGANVLPNGTGKHIVVVSAQFKAELKDKPAKQVTSPAFARQVILVLLASTTLIIAGTITAFPSVIIADLQENNSTIYGTPMTFDDTQQDLLGSIACMGALVGVWACGLSMGPLGRIPMIIILSVLGFISWVGIGLAPYPWVCLLSRGLGGFVYGVASVAGVTYIVEITDDVVRGSLTLLASGSMTTGQVVGVIPAQWFRYYVVTFINCIYPIAVFLLAVFILPESPTVLVMKGQDKKAREVLHRLRGKDADVDAEIEECKSLNEQHQTVKVLQSLRQTEVLIRLGIVCVLFVVQVFSGFTIFVAQTARIMQDSGGTVEAGLATILVQSAQLLGICITMTFVKRLGRRGCLLLSHVTMAAAVGALALFTLFVTTDENASVLREVNETRWDKSGTERMYSIETTDRLYDNVEQDLHDLLTTSTSWLKKIMEAYIPDDKSTDRADPVPKSSPYGWVPLFCIMMAQFGSSFGVQNVPFILASEYFPTAIRPQAASICVSVAWLLGVVSLQLYTPLQKLLTQTGLLFLHCGVSLLAVPFTYFCVQETVGKKVG